MDGAPTGGVRLAFLLARARASVSEGPSAVEGRFVPWPPGLAPGPVAAPALKTPRPLLHRRLPRPTKLP